MRCGPNQEHTNSELRLRFRETVKPERVLFFAQLRMAQPVGPARFAGMIVRGEIKTLGSSQNVMVMSAASMFNQMDWVDPANL